MYDVKKLVYPVIGSECYCNPGETTQLYSEIITHAITVNSVEFTTRSMNEMNLNENLKKDLPLIF